MKQLGIFPDATMQKKNEEAPVNYWKLFVDGASRNNPGHSGAGIYIVKNDHVVEQRGFYLGTKTNNQAEYLALVIGLIYLRERIDRQDLVLVISDSQLLIRQVQGSYKVRHAGLKKLHTAALQLLKPLRYDSLHVLREENEHADALANAGIDQRLPVSPDIITELTRHGISI